MSLFLEMTFDEELVAHLTSTRRLIEPELAALAAANRTDADIAGLRTSLESFDQCDGNNPGLKLIVFTLDETNYSRELAPLAGHYPALKRGPAWWFHDSIEGMTRYRQQTTETASIYNTVGFNDDTRAFPTIPARHDVARRVDANFLAGEVARHIIAMDTAIVMIKKLAYDLNKEAYNL